MQIVLWCRIILKESIRFRIRLNTSASRIYKKPYRSGGKMTQKKVYDKEFKVQTIKLDKESGFSKTAR